MSEVRDECGILLTHSFTDLYEGLSKLQHRGKEATGIAVKDGNNIDVVKWLGKVSNFGDHYLERILNVERLSNPVFMGHVRYSTSYTSSEDKKDVTKAHPRYRGGTEEVHDKHLIARNVKTAVIHNGTLQGHPDIDKVEYDTDLLLDLYEEIGAEGIVREVPAAYSAIIMDSQRDEIVAIRDRHGMRPLSIGEKKGKKVIASESRGIFSFGGVSREDMPAGSVAYITPEGLKLKQIITAPQRFCFFEINYLGHWKSSFMGKNVALIREMLGRQAAKEFHPSDITLVTYVPKSPYPMALGYAEELNIEFKDNVFYKLDEDRSFLGSEAKGRKEDIERNLYLFDNMNLDGQTIAVVDDSIVRGNVIRRVVDLLRGNGAEKIYFISMTPPIGPIINGTKHGCLYGVDMPPEPPLDIPEENFAWRKGGQTVEGVAEFSGTDQVYYLSKEGMFKAYGMPSKNFCTYCIGGPDPLK